MDSVSVTMAMCPHTIYALTHSSTKQLGQFIAMTQKTVTHLRYPLSSDAVVDHTLTFEYSESGLPLPIYNNSITRRSVLDAFGSPPRYRKRQ